MKRFGKLAVMVFVLGGCLVFAAALAGGCRVVHHSDPREALWRLAEARWRTSELPLKIVGVTGTNGKTTCSYLLEQLFAQAGHKLGVMGTVSYRWPGHEEDAPLTTPGCMALHAMLAQMRLRSSMGKPSSNTKPQLR